MKKYKRNFSLSGQVRFGAPQTTIRLDDKQIRHLKSVSHIVLVIAASAGFVLLSAVAPNIFVALDKIFGKRSQGSRTKTLDKRQRDITQSLYYLKRSGYLEVVPSDQNGYRIRLTGKGKKKLADLDFETLRVKESGKWAGTWWLVLADIPSHQLRKQADLFREKLISMGFYPLQRTVWVYPFDPREEVERIGIYYRVENFITMMEVKRLHKSDETELKEFFRSTAII